MPHSTLQGWLSSWERHRPRVIEQVGASPDSLTFRVYPTFATEFLTELKLVQQHLQLPLTRSLLKTLATNLEVRPPTGWLLSVRQRDLAEKLPLRILRKTHLAGATSQRTISGSSPKSTTESRTQSPNLDSNSTNFSIAPEGTISRRTGIVSSAERMPHQRWPSDFPSSTVTLGDSAGVKSSPLQLVLLSERLRLLFQSLQDWQGMVNECCSSLPKCLLTQHTTDSYRYYQLCQAISSTLETLQTRIKGSSTLLTQSWTALESDLRSVTNLLLTSTKSKSSRRSSGRTL